jgi:hypothetical protein
MLIVSLGGRRVRNLRVTDNQGSVDSGQQEDVIVMDLRNWGRREMRRHLGLRMGRRGWIGKYLQQFQYVSTLNSAVFPARAMPRGSWNFQIE